jgi:hypothetical protein
VTKIGDGKRQRVFVRETEDHVYRCDSSGYWCLSEKLRTMYIAVTAVATVRIGKNAERIYCIWIIC